ncbi:DUF1778 domain-containing protein [Apibacter raozihei]|uniref:type II toxin-antitoxin system TacA family antitoxin n=1 Tax=Apibacter raozihei TaxID=2500547 RepID=UPI000FE3520D|nr:DUF1778 domain-containing protein [Apibacter raozihei]
MSVSKKEKPVKGKKSVPLQGRTGRSTTDREEQQTRFDARLPKRQKELFEKAALLGGYRSLTDFVILTVKEKAEKIIEENEKIIASQADSDIFFDALMKQTSPNKALLNAAREYESLSE